jgi:hypothetical protein
MANTLYLGTDEGVVTLARKNGGWEVAGKGVDWEIQEVAYDPTAPERVMAATRGDGVWVSNDRGVSWMKPCYGKPGPGKTRCVTLDPRDPKRLFVGGEPIEIYVSEDQGKCWDRLDSVRKLPFIDNIDYPVATVEPHVRDIAIDPQDSNTIYAALQVGGMIKSTDAGKSWKHFENDQELDCDVHTIVVDSDHSNVVVVATGGHDSRGGKVKGRALYRSGDGGESWAPVAMQFTQEYSVPLVPNPKNSHVMYSALSHGTPGAWRRPTGAEAVMVRTADAGKSWEQVHLGEGPSKDFPRAIAIDPEDPNKLYLGIGTGLMSSEDGGKTWQKHSVQVPSINDMKAV